MPRQPVRQGDVLLIPVDELPKGLVRMKRDKKNRLVLADGEVTGHAHAILEDTATLFRQKDLREMSDRFLRVEQEANLVHEEHGTITLPAGDYIVRRKREYTPEKLHYVYD